MDKQVDLMQQQEKMKGQLYKEEEHRDPKFKDPKSLMYDDMKNISQEQIITNLKRMENMDRTNAEGIKQAKPLFGSAGEGQTQERKSKMKKSARKKSAKDLAKIDQDRMQYLADVEKKKIWLENPSYVPYVNLMQKRPEITSERKDVTGHERRMRAESNSKQVHATKKEMDRDLDNLVDNMMKDLYLSGKYEPSEKLKDFRKVQGIEKNMEKSLKTLGNTLKKMNMKKAKGKNWTDLDEYNLRETKLKELKTDMFMSYTKNKVTSGGAEIEVQETKLKAMEAAKKQLEEDNASCPSAYTTELIKELDKRISEQESFIEKEMQELFLKEREGWNRELTLKEALLKIADQLALYDAGKLNTDRREEFADECVEQVGIMDLLLEGEHLKKYEQFLEEQGYSDVERENLVKQTKTYTPWT